MAINFNIAEFKNQYLKHGGARSALFYATMEFPSVGVDKPGETLTYTCKAASMPSTVINKVPVPFLGRKVNVPGDRSYEEELSLTIINDEDFKVRKAFEAWVQLMQSNTTNTRSTENIYKKATLVQKDKAQKDVFKYDFFNCFPTNIGTIEVAWETTDQIQEYTVSLAYDFFESSAVGNGPTDYASGNVGTAN